MPDSDQLPPPDPDDENGLPADLPQEKLQPLLEEFANEARKIGLYTEALAVNIDKPGPDEPWREPKHLLVAQFTIGDQAFATRVQDPEADRFNDDFRKIARGDVDDEVERIRRQHMGDKDAPES